LLPRPRLVMEPSKQLTAGAPNTAIAFIAGEVQPIG